MTPKGVSGIKEHPIQKYEYTLKDPPVQTTNPESGLPQIRSHWFSSPPPPEYKDYNIHVLGTDLTANDLPDVLGDSNSYLYEQLRNAGLDIKPSASSLDAYKGATTASASASSSLPAKLPISENPASQVCRRLQIFRHSLKKMSNILIYQCIFPWKTATWTCFKSLDGFSVTKINRFEFLRSGTIPIFSLFFLIS